MVRVDWSKTGEELKVSGPVVYWAWGWAKDIWFGLCFVCWVITNKMDPFGLCYNKDQLCNL